MGEGIMGAFQNIGLKDYFKRYGVKNAIFRGLFMAWPFHVVNDYENRKILYYRKVYRGLKRKYAYAADVTPEGLRFGEESPENAIWVYWKQGIENAPDIVKCCIESIKRNTHYNIILLTENNYRDYVKFPDYIIESLNSGKMSTAAFSDLLRFSLLERYGGTWMDSTVFLSGSMPDYITEAELFAYHDSFGLIDNPAELSVWLLHSKKHNQIIQRTRNIAFEYWKHENHVVEYLLPYIILTMVYENDPIEMPYVNSEYCRLMFKEFDQNFSEKVYKHIISLTPVHKLSYKLEPDLLEKQGTFYQHLVETEI